MSNEFKSPSWQTWSIAIGTISAVFTVLVIALTFQSRSQIRQQILDRDGHVLSAVATMLQVTEHKDLPPDDIEIALQTSRLRGVLAARLFDANGNFSFAIPPSEGELADDDRERLDEGPVTRFYPHADLAEIFRTPSESSNSKRVPIQEIIIPIHDADSAETIAIIQYILDGQPVQEEFAALDRTLRIQTGTALAAGLFGLILLAALAFARLKRSHEILAGQTKRLLKANKELSVAARTSAVGAVTSHLIHGIRNPLTGLDLFFQTRNTDELPGQSPESWRQLAEATTRIRELVDDVVEVLRDQDVTTSFELSLEELEAVLQEKLLPKAKAADVRLETKRVGESPLPGHAANLVLLILVNLVDNALAVTPKEKKVWVHLCRNDSHIVFEVGDEGPGIPEEIQPHLFTAGKSGRPGGTGLGLAISHRLAANLNATLELARSDEMGTVFSLHYPIEDEQEAPAEIKSKR